jgi:phage terminase small subunit
LDQEGGVAVRSKKAEAALARAEAKIPKHTKLSHKAQKAQLSEAHRAVVDAFFANGCVSQRRALQACGYSAAVFNKPHVIFQREDVQAEIHRRRRLRERRVDVTEEKIIAELAKIAFADMGELLEVNEDGSAFMDFNKLTPDLKAAMAEYQVETVNIKSAIAADDEGTPASEGTVVKSKVKFASKQAALDSLARIKGMFRDKVEISGAMSLVERIQEARKRLQPGDKA